MACYKPLDAWQRRGGGITWRKAESNGNRQTVRCGKCIGCRLDHSKEWAIRCMHEAQMHEHNQFVTLTYNPEHLPQFGTLRKDHFQDFMKRLRKRREEKLRYFHCGEYGETYDRPHYHALIFGLDLPDRVPFQKINGNLYFRSPELEEVWGKGYVTVGAVTFESAAYVARYIMKKQSGEHAGKKYSVDGIDYSTGEIMKTPEYATMSLKPGIGESWYERYGHSDCHAHDFVVQDGKRVRVPRYYDKLLERRDPERLQKIKDLRRQNRDTDTSPERLEVRETVKRAQVGALIRRYEK